MPSKHPETAALQAIAERLIATSQAELDAMAAELRNRVNALGLALIGATQTVSYDLARRRETAVKDAIHYLLDAEYELTGDSEAFGFLYDQYGITDSEYERHFERVEAARKAKDATTNPSG